MGDNDQRRILNIVKRYDTVTWAEHYAKAQTSNIIHNKEFLTVFSYLDYDFRNKKIKALDIACSGGRYTEGLLNKGIDVIGIDTGIIPLKYASERIDAKLIRASATDLPFKRESVDLAICIELLHHFEDEVLEKVLEEIGNVIKPGGIFIFDVKNKLNPILYFTYKKNNSAKFTLKARTIKEVTKLVEKHGFEVIKKKGILSPITLFAPYIIVFARKEGV